MRVWMTILGQAATSSEQLALKQAEVAAAVEKAGGRYREFGDRAVEAYRVAQSGADLQIKVANDAATATDLYGQKEKELNHPGAPAKADARRSERVARSVYANKTIPEVIKQERIRASSFPALKQLELDSADLRTSLDHELSGALRGTTTDMLAMAHGTVTLGGGLTNLVDQACRRGRASDPDEIRRRPAGRRAVGRVVESVFAGGSTKSTQNAGAGLSASDCQPVDGSQTAAS
jgi:hypothetical protein